MYNAFENRMNQIINGLDDALCGCGVSIAELEAAVAVIEKIKDLSPNLVGLSQEDFEGILLKAIRD